MTRRRKKAEAAPNHERWLLTYADMITLLMIFFILLWSMSNADAEKFQKISASLQRAFSVDVRQATHEIAPRPGDSYFDPRIAAFLTVRGEVEAAAAASGLAPDTEVMITNEGILVTLTGNLLFESGRAELRPDALTVLDALAASVRDLPNELRVSGHTDNIPVESAVYASNWELSTARALAVARYLSASGIDGQRLSATGYGEFRPLAPNDSRANRARNRRAEILVVYPPADQQRSPLPIEPMGEPRITPIPASPEPTS